MTERERTASTADRSDGANPTEPEDSLEDVPDWDDEYVERVSDRLLHSYDLEKGYRLEGERFTLYGRLELVNQKHLFHPSLSFAKHESAEHLFVARVESVDDRTLNRFVDLGNRLADEWIEPDEDHYCTEFTFVAIAPSIPDAVRERVSGFDGRTLLKYGFHGHYEINLVVVAPDDEALVASGNADVATAFRVWEPLERERPGLLGRLARRLRS